MKKITLAILFIATSTLASAQWQTLEPGLELGRFQSPAYSNNSDFDGAYNWSPRSATINVLRIDTSRYELVLMNASHPNQNRLLTARAWAEKEGLTATINAAMYQADYLTSVSLMRTSGHINNARKSKDKTILLFEPLTKGIPAARIVDAQCDDFDNAVRQYGSAVQSIRMLSCDGKNVWKQDTRRWSIAAVGVDKDGRLLFIQCTAPHSVHEFTNILQGLPISIDRAMYMEGGSPSQMYIRTAKGKHEFTGTAGGRPVSAMSIPNVLGIRLRK